MALLGAPTLSSFLTLKWRFSPTVFYGMTPTWYSSLLGLNNIFPFFLFPFISIFFYFTSILLLFCSPLTFPLLFTNLFSFSFLSSLFFVYFSALPILFGHFSSHPSLPQFSAKRLWPLWISVLLNCSFSSPSSLKFFLWMESMGFPETSVRNYHYLLCNNPEQHSSLVITYPVMLHYLSQKWKAWRETL